MDGLGRLTMRYELAGRYEDPLAVQPRVVEMDCSRMAMDKSSQFEHSAMLE